MGKSNKFEQIIRSMKSVLDIPLTVKMRVGIMDNKNIAHLIAPKLRDWGVSFLYFIIISSLFPYFNLFVSIFIQSYVNSNLHVSTLLVSE